MVRDLDLDLDLANTHVQSGYSPGVFRKKRNKDLVGGAQGTGGAGQFRGSE